jgi:hypothetical protein
LVDAFDFYKSYAKLTYILTRISELWSRKGIVLTKVKKTTVPMANADGTTFEDDVEGTGEKKIL